MDDFFAGIITVLIAIVGVATVAVIFSKNANTAGVAQAFFGGISQDIGAAVSPITGGTGLGSVSTGFTPNF